MCDDFRPGWAAARRAWSSLALPVLEGPSTRHDDLTALDEDGVDPGTCSRSRAGPSTAARNPPTPL